MIAIYATVCQQWGYERGFGGLLCYQNFKGSSLTKKDPLPSIPHPLPNRTLVFRFRKTSLRLLAVTTCRKEGSSNGSEHPAQPVGFQELQDTILSACMVLGIVVVWFRVAGLVCSSRVA